MLSRPGLIGRVGAGARRRRGASASAGPVYGEVFFQPLTTNSGGFGSWTTVVRIKRANFLRSPPGTVTKIRITVRGKVSNMYVGLRAGSGDEYDFAATPTPVLFGGSSSVGTNAYDFNDSDVVAFTDNGVSDILIAQKYPASNAMAYDSTTGAELYYDNTGPDPSIVNKSGYSDFGASSWSVEGVQLDGFVTAAPGFLNLKGVAVGNSLTNGNGSLNIAYPNQLSSLLRYGTRITNFGIAGRTTPQLVADHQTVSSFVAGAFAIIWEIGNDLAVNQNAANAITNLQSLISQVAADGYTGKILVGTGITRAPAGLYASYDADLATVNASLRTNYAAWGAAGVIDFQADARLQNPLDTTYFSTDKLHLSQAGYLVVAQLAETKVRTLYGL